MADQSKVTTQLPASNTALAASDSVVAVQTVLGVANTVLVSVASLLGNSAVDHVVPTGKRLVLAGSAPPANSTAVGIVGQVAWDTGFLYMCVSNNSWRRIAWSTF